MKKSLASVFAVLALSLVSFAQTNTFSFNLTPISLPGGKQTVAGTAAGMTFSPTPNFDLREDTIIAPGQNFQAFMGGVNYRLPVISTKLNNASPNVDGSRFQFYVTASVGIDRITLGDTRQHYAFLAGGGINYDLTGSGKWTMGGEVRYAKFPGLLNNTVVVSLGPSIHF
jgi:hypothetical protein